MIFILTIFFGANYKLYILVGAVFKCPNNGILVWKLVNMQITSSASALLFGGSFEGLNVMRFFYNM